MFEGFRNWFAERRNFLFSWYTKDAKETQEPERSLIKLPPEIRRKVVKMVEQLPSNSADREAIVSALDESFEIWHQDPSNANNSIVILSSPVAAVSRIISESLEEWTQQKQLPTVMLPLTARPLEIESIKSKLEYHLEPKSTEDDSQADRLEVVVIPNLSWCFLRSLEGLSGIEYLQSLLCDGSKNRFWIIGGGQVGWEYLNSVCNLEAYCGKTFVLPKVTSEELQEWLEPIVKELEITFGKPRIQKQILEQDLDPKTHYFEVLADVSEGISVVAVQGFLKSLYSQEETEEETEEETGEEETIEKGEETTDDNESTVIAQTPELPEIPDLESVDQYILYSLLLHGDLTLSALAASLGDDRSEVQPRIQMLRRQGVIEQKDKILKINPIHYPKLKRQLANNNFIINKE